MTPEAADIIIPLIVSSLVSLTGVFAVYYNQKSRNKSQNFHDDMDTAKNALEIAERATKKNLELSREVESLKSILKDKHYKVTVVFTLGETPHILSSTIEAIPSHTK